MYYLAQVLIMTLLSSQASSSDLPSIDQMIGVRTGTQKRYDGRPPAQCSVHIQADDVGQIFITLYLEDGIRVWDNREPLNYRIEKSVTLLVNKPGTEEYSTDYKRQYRYESLLKLRAWIVSITPGPELKLRVSLRYDQLGLGQPKISYDESCVVSLDVD